VHVRDGAGRDTEYEIVGYRSPEALRTQITPASPIGKALLGTRSTDVPSGRGRTLEVIAVWRTQARAA
jgi:transcription elongation GreA/GreB family factor